VSLSEQIPYEHIPHPHVAAHRRARPVRVADQLGRGSAPARFNAWLAVKITTAVGTMWCAYVFALLAFVSPPAAIRSGRPLVLVSWISQTFLQLVLLSIIIVGQNILAAASDQRAEDTYNDAEPGRVHSEKIQEHLMGQDAAIGKLLERVEAIAAKMATATS